jgi:hypothetical protein
VSELVEEALDLSAIRAAYTEERGYPPYDPRLMVKRPIESGGHVMQTAGAHDLG